MVNLNGSAVAVSYDAFGRLAEENYSNGGLIQTFLYSPTGAPLAELRNGQNTNLAWMPLPGGGTAVYQGTGLSFYQHADHLGTARLASFPNRTLMYDKSFAAFGEDYNDLTSIQTWDWMFADMRANTAAGSTPDSATLYDAMYREYAPTQSRWISPDPAGLAAVNMTNPQTWNRYAYVTNNPLSFIDPSGLRDCGFLEPGCRGLYFGAGNPGNGSSPGDSSSGGAGSGGAGGFGPGGAWGGPGPTGIGETPEMYGLDPGPIGPSFGGLGGFGGTAGCGSDFLPCGPPASTGPGLPCDFGYCGPSIGNGFSPGSIAVEAATWGVRIGSWLDAAAGLLPLLLMQTGDGVPHVHMSRDEQRFLDYIARSYCVDRIALGEAIHEEKASRGMGPGDNLSKDEIRRIAQMLPKIPGCTPTGG